jgi:hypothetical protein
VVAPQAGIAAVGNPVQALPAQFEPVMLIGGRGADRLFGSSAAEVLTGGKGRDVFVFGNADLISDFSAKRDKLDLSALGVTADNFHSKVVLIKQGRDTLVQVDDQSMLMSGVSPAKLKQSAFLLAESMVTSSFDFTRGAIDRVFAMAGDDSGMARWSNMKWGGETDWSTIGTAQLTPVSEAFAQTPLSNIGGLMSDFGIAIELSAYSATSYFGQSDMPNWANILPGVTRGDWAYPNNNALSVDQIEQLAPINGLGIIAPAAQPTDAANSAFLPDAIMDDLDIFHWSQDYHNGPLF